ncbi:MAG: peptidylprolyl isomerase [Thermomicrobiales bacterium]|nr:peptidylprolyl isomerase [Thermomicrobiales bacterium]
MRRILVLVLLISLSASVSSGAHSQDSIQSTQEGQARAEESDCWIGSQKYEVDGVPNWHTAPTLAIDPEKTYLATLLTSAGEIVVELDVQDAPIAANNFICLARSGYYNSTSFHRVAEDFFIQGGDPTGTGLGTPGYVVPSDPTTGPYPAGAVALANKAPDENGAQFFIAATDLTGQIPEHYPVFGRVISGLETVVEVSRGSAEPNERGEVSAPRNPTIIDEVQIQVIEDEIGPPIAPITPTPIVEATPPLVLIGKDIAYDPTTLTIQAADEPVTITFENVGAAEHDFVIDALEIHVVAMPGETVDIVIPAGTAPGTYDFYCSVPGHKEAGMVGTLVVE